MALWKAQYVKAPEVVNKDEVLKKGWEGKGDTSLDQFSAVKEGNCGPATLKTRNKRLISKYDQKRNRKN
jgi:hypothetical protein